MMPRTRKAKAQSAEKGKIAHTWTIFLFLLAYVGKLLYLCTRNKIFDLNDFQALSLKCQPERIDEIIVPSRLRTEGTVRLYRQSV